MFWFKKNGSSDIIEFNGSPDDFVWKSPVQNFTFGSQIIVDESQIAILKIDGQLCDTFGPGRHAMDVMSVPGLTEVLGKSTRGKSPFRSEVYFINAVNHMGIKWGMKEGVLYAEPQYNDLPINISANGIMNLSINKDHARYVLKYLVGTRDVLSQKDFEETIIAALQGNIKSFLVRLIVAKKIGILSMDANLIELASCLNRILQPVFDNYGFTLNTFTISEIVRPEENADYKRLIHDLSNEALTLREARLNKAKEEIEAEMRHNVAVWAAKEKAAGRRVEGYTIQQAWAYEVAKTFADNGGVGNFTNAGIGLGMMAGVAGGLGNTFTEIINGVVEPLNDSSIKSPPQVFPEQVELPPIQLPADSDEFNPSEKTPSDSFEPDKKEFGPEQASVTCPGCRQLVPLANFCLECGARLNNVCRGCGHSIPTSAKFCPDCGCKQ